MSGAEPAAADPWAFPGVSGVGFAYRPGVEVALVNAKVTDGEVAAAGTVGNLGPGPPAPLAGDVRFGEPDRSGEATPMVSKDQIGSFDNAAGTILVSHSDNSSMVTTVAGTRMMVASM